MGLGTRLVAGYLDKQVESQALMCGPGNEASGWVRIWINKLSPRLSCVGLGMRLVAGYLDKQVESQALMCGPGKEANGWVSEL